MRGFGIWFAAAGHCRPNSKNVMMILVKVGLEPILDPWSQTQFALFWPPDWLFDYPEPVDSIMYVCMYIFIYSGMPYQIYNLNSYKNI